MANIVTILNFIMVLIKAGTSLYKYFYNKASLTQKELERMQSLLSEWGVREANTPGEVKKDIGRNRERLRKLFNQHRGNKR